MTKGQLDLKIVKITTTWDDGKVVSIEEPDVTSFLSAGTEATRMYLLLSFARNLKGGFNWREDKLSDGLLKGR